MPLYRLEQEFKRNDIHISRQTMSSWWSKAVNAIYLYYMTGCISRSIRALWSMRMKHQSKSRETAGIRCATVICGFIVLVQKMDNSQWSCMKYQKTRNSTIRRSFLKGYEGTIVCDGFEAYHKIARENAHITVAGCWTHARRKYVQICKALGKKSIKKEVLQKLQLPRSERSIIPITAWTGMNQSSEKNGGKNRYHHWSMLSFRG